MLRTHPTRRTRCLAAALALVLVLDAVSLLGIPHTTEAPSAAAALPVGNGRIAFDSNRGGPQNPEGDFEIFTMEPDGSDVIQLTGGSANDISPAWSADGKRIAFQSERDGNREIYTMLADGGGQTRLTTSPGIDSFPAWSPNGAKIAFESTRRGGPDIFVMNADGSNQGRVGSGRGPDWSPDGSKIVGYQQVGNQHDIVVMGAESGNPVNLTNDPANEYEPVWSPDGSQIAFTRDEDDQSEIVTMAADGADPVNRTNHGAIDEAPSWQPLPGLVPPRIVVGPPKFKRGGDILFASDRLTPNNPERDFEIFTLETGGGGSGAPVRSGN